MGSYGVVNLTLLNLFVPRKFASKISSIQELFAKIGVLVGSRGFAPVSNRDITTFFLAENSFFVLCERKKYYNKLLIA
jgi:hypothetical protein